MKRIVLTLALAVAALFAVAQNQPSGIRMEIAEATVNEERYCIFTYADADGTFGYYLSLGHEEESFSIGGGFGTIGASRYDETCLYLGATRNEALAMLDTLLSFYDREPGTVVAVPARMSTGGERMGQDISVECEVHKKLLGGKRLVFRFPSGRRTGEVYLGKSTVKQLRWSLKSDRSQHHR